MAANPAMSVKEALAIAREMPTNILLLEPEHRALRRLIEVIEQVAKMPSLEWPQDNRIGQWLCEGCDGKPQCLELIRQELTDGR